MLMWLKLEVLLGLKPKVKKVKIQKLILILVLVLIKLLLLVLFIIINLLHHLLAKPYILLNIGIIKKVAFQV